MTLHTPDAPPIACSLGAGDFRARLAWIADLNRRALRAQRRDGLRLELTYAGEARDEVLDLVRGEQACCGFLNFQVLEAADAVRVVIEAPERAREAAESVFAPFLAPGPADLGCSCCGAAQ